MKWAPFGGNNDNSGPDTILKLTWELTMEKFLLGFSILATVLYACGGPRQCTVQEDGLIKDPSKVNCVTYNGKPGNGYVLLFNDSGTNTVVSEASVKYNKVVGPLTIHYSTLAVLDPRKGLQEVGVSETIETAGCCRTIKMETLEAFEESVQTDTEIDKNGVRRTDVSIDGFVLNQVIYRIE